MSKTAVIIVTHDSQQVLPACLAALDAQTTPAERICIVDSGSKNPSYLSGAVESDYVTIIREERNIGFAGANNIGFAHVREWADYVVFLNPDTFLDADFIEQALVSFQELPKIGIVTGRMLGFDINLMRPTGRIDSTGILRTWYGRWFDRGQGEKDQGQYCDEEDIPAACGALMFCRQTALSEAALAGGSVFDPDFFLYKEDIELCLRLRNRGWGIRYLPGLSAFHGRGWHRQRRKMDVSLRRMAAAGEVLLYRKHPSPYIIWALVKYFMVTVFHV